MAAPADVHDQHMQRFKALVPDLTAEGYKGQNGKVAVVGGSREFTGAPYFAAMSALRSGADMAYVVCSPTAATAIKSYSPELMVLPLLPHDDPEERMDLAEESPDVRACRSMVQLLPWLQRASVLVVGPGLGGDAVVCAAAAGLMRHARSVGLPLLVDGSALTHIVANDPGLVRGYRRCVLTPNVAELGRIARAVGVELPGPMGTHWQQHAPRVAEALGGPLVVAKGPADLICGPQGMQPVACSVPAALRRCGGQGDVLAGTAAAFIAWASKQQQAAGGSIGSAGDAGDSGQGNNSQEGASAAAAGAEGEALVAAVYAACTIMRRASASAFAQHERSMLAGDIIPHLYPAFKELMGRA